jgi:glycosyltransferase involved in cell wall biosynthesis
MMSVIFASHNGGAVLPKMLESLARAETPAGGWKLVAVDNASTDDTRSILESYRDRLPLAILNEPVPSKNRSLNRGLEIAEGDFYVFCDDDVIVQDDWLVKWRAAADGHPEFELFAGSTVPHWPTDAPKLRMKDMVISIAFGTNEQQQGGPCDSRCMFGTNMAIRASVFQTGVRFNENIGPNGSLAYPMGSETEFALRLAALGYKCWFADDARVRHIIRPKQMQIPAILLRGYRWGRGQAHMREEHHYSPSRLSRKNHLRWALYPLLMPFFDPDEAWARQWEWVADQGYEDGWRECQGLAPKWLQKQGPRLARRFRR